MMPDFRLEASGVDISANLRNRLLKLVVVDQAGLTSDSLAIDLDNRDDALPLPQDKTEFKAWLGYRPPGILPAYMGRFILTGYTLSNGPSVMSVRARAADLADEFKAPKTRSWPGKKLSEIISQIAKEHGLEPRINEKFADYLVTHIDQAQESDCAFVTRLAEMYGAVGKPGDGKLIFVPWGEGKLANGEPAPVITLTPRDVTSWKADWAKRGDYGSVIASYHDHGEGKPMSVKHDGGKGPTYQVRRIFPTKADAEKAAQAQYDVLKAGTFAVDLTLPGRPDLYAECPLVLAGGFRSELRGEWIIKSVTHTFSNAGYSCSLAAERQLLNEASEEKKKEGSPS